MTDKTGYSKGLWAEMRAAVFLRRQGYKILQRRFRTRHGEIDIICQKGKMLVFVEVKLRATTDDAAAAIDGKNQQRVRQAAELYLQKYPDYTGFDLRFDALLMGRHQGISQIENAF